MDSFTQQILFLTLEMPCSKLGENLISLELLERKQWEIRKRFIRKKNVYYNITFVYMEIYIECVKYIHFMKREHFNPDKFECNIANMRCTHILVTLDVPATIF